MNLSVSSGAREATSRLIPRLIPAALEGLTNAVLACQPTRASASSTDSAQWHDPGTATHSVPESALTRLRLRMAASLLAELAPVVHGDRAVVERLRRNELE